MGKLVSSRFKNGKQISQKVNFPPAMIGFTICTNQFHLWQNGCESLKPAWYEIWLFQKNTNFLQEKQDYFLRYSLSPGNFPLEWPKKSCSIYFTTGFSGNFLVFMWISRCQCQIHFIILYSIRKEKLINTVTRLVKISVILCRMQIWIV